HRKPLRSCLVHMAELTFQCQVCRTPLSADESQVGTLVRCPVCKTALRVPSAARSMNPPQPVGAGAPSGGATVTTSAGATRPTNCKSCGMPFTMEGTTLEAAGTSNGFCVAALVLGIIGLPASCIVLPSILAVIFGVIGYNQVTKNGGEATGKGMAIAGMICGGI